MRAHRENEQWINHRVMPMYPDEMVVLYKQQLLQVEQSQLTQQFGYDFEIHKDGFYRFLEVMHGWEQGLIIKEKENFEKNNPAKIYTNNADFSKFDKASTSNFNAASKSYDYSNPFAVIYCKGDDISHATIKPTITYEEVPGSKIEIPNMPAYKTQDDIGDCKAFSLAAILQWYTCRKWKSDIPDCKNPPADSAISYFGMMEHTNQDVGQPNTFQPNQDSGRGINVIINDISKNGSRLILESCRPFDTVVNSFSRSGQAGLDKRDKFFGYLKSLYLDKKGNAITDSGDCNVCLTAINATLGFNISVANLKEALAKSTFDKFLYSLFFDGCERESFPSGFSARAYPADHMNVTPGDIKNQIVDGLKQGKPVLFPGLCLSKDKGDECKLSHSLVVSGYKKVCENGNLTNYREVFKLHNSWGAEWQKMNNDGWVDADAIAQNTVKTKGSSGYRIDSGSVMWIDP